ncbi:DUF1501 domain-containing protein [Lignipirellula cremea]|uniref:DUF1501 domain-containing protein n=1 Tax=Lignipirellula cremea TaxID=2528010 RepID=A0A518E484_9BACT|nr:DUF1501 domain-containing protein [Lignipirellula cremea]QDU98916.1 hypothetical protein Pla8534_68270 [Lignipirellula cremea]
MSMHSLTRRSFFHRISDGVHGAALASLLTADLFGDAKLSAGETAHETAADRRTYDLRPRPPHQAPRAKSVIQLFMNGGPSQVDTFDPKPLLKERHGQPYFAKIAKDVSSPQSAGGLMGSPFQFKQHGESGIWLSEVMPHLAKQVDDIAVIRSMFNSHPNHEPALFKIHTGRLLPGRPSIGAWVAYGLGSENQSLPAYVVMDDPLGLPVNTVQNWQSGFLPPVYQGTRLRTFGSPILNLKPEQEYPDPVKRLQRDLLSRLDAIHKQERPGMLQLDARIASYELAARMQLEATDALDLSQETSATLEAYGVNVEPTDSYARRCLMARRLVERGVRYIQIYINGQIWDNHSNIRKTLPAACRRTDQPVAALLADLKQRGLLDDTLVIWGGEFGRLPIAQMRNGSNDETAGRDHGPRGFSLWMAGGGVRGGTTYGGTDEIGYAAEENPVSIADWHATVLHLLGLHHEKLFFDRNGLHEKLTDTFKPRIVNEILS